MNIIHQKMLVIIFNFRHFGNIFIEWYKQLKWWIKMPEDEDIEKLNSSKGF